MSRVQSFMIPTRANRPFSLTDDGERGEIKSFGTPGGGIITPPVHLPEVRPGVGVAVAWDSVNGSLAGVEVREGAESVEMTVAWHLDVRPSMQPVVYRSPMNWSSTTSCPAPTAARRPVPLGVVDVATGALIDHVPTGSRVANGMFLSAASNRRVLYASTTAVALAAWF